MKPKIDAFGVCHRGRHRVTLESMTSQVSSKHGPPGVDSTRDGAGATPLGGARSRDVCVLGGLLILTVALAIQLYQRYLASSRAQWTGLGHDRNAHLLESMRLALDLRYLDLTSFISDLHRMKNHPPLFRMLAAPILALGGFHYPLAALVSLAGWIGTVILAFLLARRIAPSHGNTAGLFAAACIISSPPFQAYATDIMLESLGACLTLLAFYLYSRATDTSQATRWVGPLGWALTALFFLKYNYWFLVACVLVLWEGLTRRREIAVQVRNWWIGHHFRAVVRKSVHHPSTWITASFTLVAAYLLFTGRRELSWGGRRIGSITDLDAIYAAYVVLWIHFGRSFRKSQKEIRLQLGEPAWALFCSHVLPVSLWLLWPLKLQNILWYLSPMDSAATQRAAYWNWETIGFYPRAILTEYHESGWVGIAVVALAAYAFLRTSQLGPPGRLVLLFLATSAILTLLHPNHQGRFLHPWVPTLWVAASVGFVSSLRRLTRAPAMGRAISWAVGGVLILALAAPALSWVFAHRSAPGRGPRPPTALDLSDYYLPRIGCYAHVTIFATVGVEAFAAWTYLQRYPAQRRSLSIVSQRFGEAAEAKSKHFREWLQQTPTQALVFIDATRESLSYWPGAEHLQQYRELVGSQVVFHEVERRAFPQHGATVHILVRPGQDGSRLHCEQLSQPGNSISIGGST
jgi:hypothetical protein